MSVVLGIDPGLRGAAAVLEVVAPDGVISGWRLLDVEDAGLVLGALKAADLVVLETQRASPQMGVASAFALGRAHGVWLGLLAAASPRAVRHVEPAAWRGAFGLTSKEDGVDMAREVVGEPTRALLRHDEADALLLAWWGWRMVLSKAG